MGEGIIIKCNNCNKEYHLLFGSGMLYPQACRNAREKALNGELGEEWKKIISENPYYVVDATKYLYWCPKCHRFEMGESYSIYKPRDLKTLLKEKYEGKTLKELGYNPGWPDFERIVIKEGERVPNGAIPTDFGFYIKRYLLFKEYVRKCYKCDTAMERKDLDDVHELELVCPECGGAIKENIPENATIEEQIMASLGNPIMWD